MPESHVTVRLGPEVEYPTVGEQQPANTCPCGVFGTMVKWRLPGQYSLDGVKTGLA